MEDTARIKQFFFILFIPPVCLCGFICSADLRPEVRTPLSSFSRSEQKHHRDLQKLINVTTAGAGVSERNSHQVTIGAIAPVGVGMVGRASCEALFLQVTEEFRFNGHVVMRLASS